MLKKDQLTRAALNLNLSLLVFAVFFFNPASALTKIYAENALPNFTDFFNQVQNGEADMLRGVYVSGVLAMPVVQQPVGWPNFVSPAENQITQFGMAAEHGNVGLLAHNSRAGTAFPLLLPDQEVRLIYGDGHIEYFVVRHILSFQALKPHSPFSDFRDLETNITISSGELFDQVYRGERHVTFQTCINANFNASWGRLFVIAEPMQRGVLGNRR